MNSLNSPMTCAGLVDAPHWSSVRARCSVGEAEGARLAPKRIEPQFPERLHIFFGEHRIFIFALIFAPSVAIQSRRAGVLYWAA